jgi:hypothetical protein
MEGTKNIMLNDIPAVFIELGSKTVRPRCLAGRQALDCRLDLSLGEGPVQL